MLRTDSRGELCEKEFEHTLQAMWYRKKENNSIYIPIEWSFIKDEWVTNGEGDEYAQWSRIRT